MQINAYGSGISVDKFISIPHEIPRENRASHDHYAPGSTVSTNSDSVIISDRARKMFETSAKNNTAEDENQASDSNAEESGTSEKESKQVSAEKSDSAKPNGEPLNDEEKQQVEKLKERDRHVKAHEQAHLSAAGNLAAGGAKFKYQKGPDGRQYAVGGEVGIRIPEGKTPQETLTIAQRVERAALAPSDPSAQDRSVANQARQKETKARRQIVEESSKQTSKGNLKSQETENNSGTTPASENSSTENSSAKVKGLNDVVQPENKKNPYEIYNNNITNPGENRNSQGVNEKGIPTTESSGEIDRGMVTFNLHSPRGINCLV